MFHLYFGGFDLLLYTIALIFALALSNAICTDSPTPSSQGSSEQTPLSQTIEPSPTPTVLTDSEDPISDPVERESCHRLADEIISLCTPSQSAELTEPFDLKSLVDTLLFGDSEAEKRQAIATIKERKPSANDWREINLVLLRKVGSRLNITNAARMNKTDVIHRLATI